MNVGVAYADRFKQVWMKLDVPDGSTVQQVIAHSGILEQFPEIDLSTQKVGIFGKLGKLDTLVEEGARVEIYRAITADPNAGSKDDDDDDDD